jgi:hypothetical protein
MRRDPNTTEDFHMTTQRFDRAAIMRRAHQLRREQGLDMSAAMKA